MATSAAGDHQRFNNDSKVTRLIDHTLLTGALLALCALIFQSILSQPPLQIEQYQKYSLLAISIAMPALSLWCYLSKRPRWLIKDIYIYITATTFVVGLLSALIGIGLAFWRYFDWAGYIFFGSSLVTVFCYVTLSEDNSPKKG
jgi:energy-converting hydrogenase Eha subunit A